jgi:hypothetical protein
MKITKSQLRKIIKEEISRILEMTPEEMNMLYGDPSKDQEAGHATRYDRMGMEQKGRYDANEGKEPQYKGDEKYMRGYKGAMAEKGTEV